MQSVKSRLAAASAAVVLAALALAGPAAAATVPPVNGGSPPYVPTQGSPMGPASQGIIMRDGGICDPIRHMGC